jgi:hypothetical protein
MSPVRNTSHSPVTPHVSRAQGPVALPAAPLPRGTVRADHFASMKQGSVALEVHQPVFTEARSVAFGEPAPVSNGFHISMGGRNPPVAAGGFFEQLKQAANTARLALLASRSISSGGRDPSDFEVVSKLRSLGLMLPTSDVRSITHSDYFSQLPGVSPDRAYTFAVGNPGAMFAAGGMKLRPEPHGPLRDGQRLMIESKGPPNVWMPVEVRLDPARREIRIATLDGHALRGTNHFQFTSDGQGGTRVNQPTSYQLSSKAVELGFDDSKLQLQHDTWRKVHQFLFDRLKPEAGEASALVR